MTNMIGAEVRIREGVHEAGKRGRVISNAVHVGGQWWVGVEWESDDEEDPDWFKASGLEVARNEWGAFPLRPRSLMANSKGPMTQNKAVVLGEYPDAYYQGINNRHHIWHKRGDARGLNLHSHLDVNEEAAWASARRRVEAESAKANLEAALEEVLACNKHLNAVYEAAGHPLESSEPVASAVLKLKSRAESAEAKLAQKQIIISEYIDLAVAQTKRIALLEEAAPTESGIKDLLIDPKDSTTWLDGNFMPYAYEDVNKRLHEAHRRGKGEK